MVRINLNSGRIARSGDKNVILEAFKPGTEPSGKQKVIGGTYTPSAGAGLQTGAGAGTGARVGTRVGAGTKVGTAAAVADVSGLY
jgi:penicillin-binding protein 1A